MDREIYRKIRGKSYERYEYNKAGQCRNLDRL